jgi:hypothetical protein
MRLLNQMIENKCREDQYMHINIVYKWPGSKSYNYIFVLDLI